MKVYAATREAAISAFAKSWRRNWQRSAWAQHQNQSGCPLCP